MSKNSNGFITEIILRGKKQHYVFRCRIHFNNTVKLKKKKKPFLSNTAIKYYSNDKTII